MLLVGGSSRIPLVGQMVGAALGVPVVTDAHPKFSIALGAARLAESSAAAGAAPEPAPDPAAKKKKKPAVPVPVLVPEASEEEADEPDGEEEEAAPPPPPTPPPIAKKKKAAAVVVEPDTDEQVGLAPEPAPVHKKGPGPLDTFKDRFRARRMVLIPILTLIALLAGGQIFLGSEAQGSQDEIFLAPKDQPGENPFTPASSELPPAPLGSDVVIPVASTGTDPALYAGSRGSASCRTEALIMFLEASENAARRKVWAAAAGVAEGDIRPYVNSLTPAWTRADARVTEFVLKEGKAAPRQIVLEGGSAVLLDRTGFPRVRCVSGSPLDQARKPPKPPKFVGTRWKGFTETTVVVIAPGVPAQVITLFDPTTRTNFGRLPGSIVIIDIDTPAPGAQLTVVEPGQPSTITGALWPPGTAVTITFDNPPDTLGVATADGAGAFAQGVNIPDGSRPGIHQVTMTGGGFTVTQVVYVIPRGVRVVRTALPGSLERPAGNVAPASDPLSPARNPQ